MNKRALNIARIREFLRLLHLHGFLFIPYMPLIHTPPLKLEK